MTVPYLAREHPIRLAHRGSRVLWPENTMEAFRGAVELGYNYIETDVRVSRDGHVVVFHDATLERTTNGTGKVAEWNLEELRELDAAYHFDAPADYPRRGAGVAVSTLAEVFAAFPDVCFNIDLKGPGMEWLLAEVIHAAGREDSVMVGSFVGHRTAKFRRITRGAIATSAGPADTLAMWAASRRGHHVTRRVEAYQLPFDYRALPIDQRYVDAIHAAGAQVHFWTVNEPADMCRLLDMGADGIVTDRPDLLNEVIAQRAG
jgi:glycerophosphoryl diester phosphodiesterase